MEDLQDWLNHKEVLTPLRSYNILHILIQGTAEIRRAWFVHRTFTPLQFCYSSTYANETVLLQFLCERVLSEVSPACGNWAKGSSTFACWLELLKPTKACSIFFTLYTACLESSRLTLNFWSPWCCSAQTLSETSSLCSGYRSILFHIGQTSMKIAQISSLQEFKSPYSLAVWSKSVRWKQRKCDFLLLVLCSKWTEGT